MKNIILFTVICIKLISSISAYGKSDISFNKNRPVISIDGNVIITSPEEGLWSIAKDWSDDWMTNWIHASPHEEVRVGEWTILHGKLSLPEGAMILRDSYRKLENGLIHCIRRFEWQGPDTLKKATLSVRFQMKGDKLNPFIPGVLYYGNKMGASVNPDIIPVYNGKNGEFAIFEDHRFPMPFAMLENASQKCAAAIHTTPRDRKSTRLNSSH